MLDISSNIDEVTKHLTAIQKQVIPQASSTALNKTTRTVSKEIKRDVAKDTGLKQKEVAERMSLVKANKHTQAAYIKMSGRYFNLIHFKARQIKKGVKAKAWGKSKLYRGAFIANKGRTVFARMGKKRLPIRGVAGPNPAVELNERMKNPNFNKRVVARFDKVFSQELKYRLGRMR